VFWGGGRKRKSGNLESTLNWVGWLVAFLPSFGECCYQFYLLESSLGYLAGGLGCEDTPKDIVFPSFCNTINPKFSTTQKKKDWFHKKCV
jgi:hypothetical protein